MPGLLDALGALTGSNQLQPNPNFDPNQPVGPNNLPYAQQGAWGRLTGGNAAQANAQALGGSVQQLGDTRGKLAVGAQTGALQQALANITGQYGLGEQSLRNQGSQQSGLIDVIGRLLGTKEQGEQTRQTQQQASDLESAQELKTLTKYMGEDAAKQLLTQRQQLNNNAAAAGIAHTKAQTGLTEAGTRGTQASTARAEAENEGLGQFGKRTGFVPLPSGEMMGNPNTGMMVTPGNEMMMNFMNNFGKGTGLRSQVPIKLDPDKFKTFNAPPVPNGNSANTTPLSPPGTSGNAPSFNQQPAGLPQLSTAPGEMPGANPSPLLSNPLTGLPPQVPQNLGPLLQQLNQLFQTSNPGR